MHPQLFEFNGLFLPAYLTFQLLAVASGALWLHRHRARFELPAEFVVPGEEPVAALLDVARTVVRRAERSSLGVAPSESLVVPYLNRLSDLLWTLARWREGESRRVRDV